MCVHMHEHIYEYVCAVCLNVLELMGDDSYVHVCMYVCVCVCLSICLYVHGMFKYFRVDGR